MTQDDIDKMMERLPHYRSQYNAAKKIHVYFVPGINQQTGTKIYFYAIASELLHMEMMRCLTQGDIPHFAVVVEKGIGEPTAEIKKKIKDYYGFDHDHYAVQA
jgi:hypothetical protein